MDYSTSFAGPDIGLMLYYLGFVAFTFILLLIIRAVVKRIAQNSSYFDHAIFLVRLPKDRPGDRDREETVQEIREDIALAETMFSSIGGLRAQRGLKAWLLGRNDHYSFEIVGNRQKIAFYAVCPRDMSRYLEQQINAHYPDAVIEEVGDYNIFHPRSSIKAGYLKTRKSFIYPLKTYLKMDADPMNSIVNVMSKLDEDEGIAVQYVVRSAKAGWHSRIAEIRRHIRAGKPLSEAISRARSNRVWSAIKDIFGVARPRDLEKERMNQQYSRLTSGEEETLKGIEEKNAKAGLDVNLRIVVSADNPGKARGFLDNLASAYGQYNHYENGNVFFSQVITSSEKKTIRNFIYRRFNSNISFLLNTEELAGLFHFPLKSAETPNILWLTAKHAAAPSHIPRSGLLLGRNIYRGQVTEVYIKRADRRRHTYVIGKSGVGKSVLLASMAIQDICNGEGVCVIDPHGDLINDIIERVPPERAEDVILFAPADIERPMALNLMEYDPRYPEQKTFVINEMIKIFDKLYDLKQTGGPIFEQYMRNAMLLVMAHPESGSTLMEIPKVLSDPAFRRMKLEKCSDPTVVDFWRQEAEKAGGDAALANVVPYITSKLTQFISNDTMRPIIGQQKSSFNMRDVMDRRKILLVDLSKGQVGEMNSYLLGMILVGKILMSALSRTDIPQEQRKDFYLYIDEFQNFTTDSISSILSEARKYNLNLTIAHQYLGQLVKNSDTSIRDAVFGNVGTWITFKIGSEDSESLEKEFSPVFNQYDLINIEKYTAYVKLLVDNTATRAFSMHTIWPLPGQALEGGARKIRDLSRFKYGQDRKLIEAEIKRRTQV